MSPSRRPAQLLRQATAVATVAVLIVDDNATKRRALSAVLSPLGYPVVEAESGREALRCVMAQDFAVILLDVLMPDMDGFETAALIRQRRQSEMTPIIFITAYERDDIKQADRYVEGAVDFIFAPVPADELRAKVAVFAKLFIKAETLATTARSVQTTADQLRLLTEAAPIGIFQTDSENRYVYTNPRWTEITGVPAEEAIGRPWDTIIGPEQQADLIGALGEGALHRGELSHRLEIRRADAPSRIVLVTSKAVPDADDGIAGWVGTLADVTAEVGAEEAMSDARDKADEASRQKSDFLVNMSHEIRTPMNGVIGTTDLLLETDLDARQRDYAQTVRNSAEALLIIINDILDFSKVEAGKLDIEDIEFCLRTIVDDVVDLLAGTAQTKGLELIAVIDNAVPAVVSGDPGRLRQVLTNLIGNAIKFTQRGEIVVRVTGADLVDTDNMVRIEVSDTGDGIATDKLDQIFLPFVQADSSTSRKYGGTGLGLAISAKLVALMGGICGVTSRIGAGSTFWFTIRVHAGARSAAPALPSSDARLSGVRALIVDDSMTQRGVLAAYLTEWGMTPIAAASGPAALAMLRTAAIQGKPFAVAIIDRFMPDMDGLEVRDAVAADPAITASVVLMTGLGQERDLGDVGQSGLGISVTKPIHAEDLKACLLRALGLVAEMSPADAVASGPILPGKREVGRILLAEDNLINQKVAVAILSTAGYIVDTALNGTAAVAAAAAARYDAILMDCQMPELNGYEATTAIREHEASGARAPIIGMTAGARREDHDRCIAAGMDGYLAKPVGKDALLALVARSMKTDSQRVPVEDGSEGLHPTTVDGMAHLADPDRPALDEVVVGRLGRLGESVGRDLVGELATLFLADAGAKVAALRQALVDDDPAAALTADSLSGASANLGATALAQLCATLATDGLAADVAGRMAMLEAIEEEFGRVRLALGPQVALS